jgi:hypothetical protein
LRSVDLKEGKPMDVVHCARRRLLLPALAVVGVLLIGAPVSAVCRPFGTQVECEGRMSRLVLGTQTSRAPTYARSLRPQAFQGSWRLGDGRAALERPLQLDLQDIGTDPNLCRRIGNETYCY